MSEPLSPASGFRHGFSKFKRDLSSTFRSMSPNPSGSRTVNISQEEPKPQAVEADKSAPNTTTANASESATPLWASAMDLLEGVSDVDDKYFGLSKENFESASSYLNREPHGPLIPNQPSSAVIERLRTYAPVLASLKGAAMAGAQLDPHKIAPYVVAGVFFLVEFSINTIPPDERVAIEELFVGIDSIILRWQRFELYKMPRWTLKSELGILASLKVLKEKIPEIYTSALKLQTKIRKACRSDGSRLVTVLLKRRILWETDLKNLKVLNEICEQQVAKIGDELEFSNKNAEILNYIKQSDDPEPAHLSLRERLRLDQAANIETGQWFVAGHVREFCALQSQDPVADGSVTGSPVNRVMHDQILWLRGTVGTGKTTLMCQAITYLQNQQALRGQGLFRIAYYYCDAKSNNAGSNGPDPKCVVRGLCAKLARLPEWDARTRASIDSQVQHFHDSISLEARKSSALVTWKQWQDLFTRLVDATAGDLVIVIDALDECMDVNDLLDFLGKAQRTRPAFKLLLSSREHVSVDTYFGHRLKHVQCSSQNTADDLKAFINGRLATLAEEAATKGSIYFNEKFTMLQQEVHDALRIGANGMFKWVDIWLTIVFPTEPRYQTMHEEEALEEISLIKTSSSPSSHGAFDQLRNTYDLLWEANSAVKGASGSLTVLFRIVLSALQPLTLQQLHEARLIHANKKLSTDAESSYLSTGYMCTNFLTENSSGALVWSHASAKEYVEQRADRKGELEFTYAKSQELMFDLCCQLIQDCHHRAWKHSGFDLDRSRQLLYKGNAGHEILTEFESVCDQYNTVKSTIKEIDGQALRDAFQMFLQPKPSASILRPLFGPESFALYVAYWFPEHMSIMASRFQSPPEVYQNIVRLLSAGTSAVKPILFTLAAAQAILNQAALPNLVHAREHMRMIKTRKPASRFLPAKLFTPQLNLIDGFEARFWSIMNLGDFDTWQDAVTALPEPPQIDVAGFSDLWPLLGSRRQLRNKDEDSLRSSLAHELARSGTAAQLRFVLELEVRGRGEARSLQLGDDNLSLPVHHVVGRMTYGDEALQVVLHYDPLKSQPWNCGTRCQKMDRIYSSSPISMLFVKNCAVGLPINEAAKAGNVRAVEALLQREFEMVGTNGQRIHHSCGQQLNCQPRSRQLFESGCQDGLAVHQAMLQAFITESHSDCIFKMLEFEQKWRTLHQASPPLPPPDVHRVSSQLLSERSAYRLTLQEICEYRLASQNSHLISREEASILVSILERLRTRFVAEQRVAEPEQECGGPAEEEENLRLLGSRLRRTRLYAVRNARVNRRT